MCFWKFCSLRIKFNALIMKNVFELKISAFFLKFWFDMLQVVALICNFPGSHNLSVRLNHHEVETLFHEFGHALHSLLSRTVFY